MNVVTFFLDAKGFLRGRQTCRETQDDHAHTVAKEGSTAPP